MKLLVGVAKGVDFVLFVAARGRSDRAFEVNQMNHVEAVAMPPPFPLCTRGLGDVSRRHIG